MAGSSGLPEEALQSFHALQVTLGYTKGVVAQYRCYGHTELAIDAFLLRFLISENNDSNAAAAKISARRIFERSLPAFSITPSIVAALRSGAFSILGRDASRRVVLYVNLRHFTLPSLEMDEVQRLVLLLLEYMQFLALEEAGSSAATSSTSTYLQQFVIVLNEEEVEWHTQQSLLGKANTVHSIFDKYYPGLVGLVLVVGAGLETREGIKASLQSFPNQIKDNVQFIQRSSLKQYMDREIVPVELGGVQRTATDGMNFSEMVLRHWYTLTTFLMEEAATGPKKDEPRPLFMPPPQRSIMSSSLPSGQRLHIFSPASQNSSFAHRPGENGGDEEDDGLCSLITQGEETDDRTELILKEDADANSMMFTNPHHLLKAYRLECAMRKAAEQRLQLAHQPLHLDPRHATVIEKSLSSIHRDVNTLVGDVVTRAKASAVGVQGPSLRQLLEITIAALESAAGTPSPPPAMETAGPAEEEIEKEGCFCCC